MAFCSRNIKPDECQQTVAALLQGPFFDNARDPIYSVPSLKTPVDMRKWESFGDLEAFYHENKLKLPPLAKIWMEDSEFGRFLA